MKKSKLLIAIMLLALSFMAATLAHAAITTTQSSSLFDGPGAWVSGLFGSGSGSNSGSGLNSNIWFLVVAGGAIGCRVIVKNSKQVQLQKA